MAGCRGGRKKIKQEICSIEVAMKQLKTHDVSTKNWGRKNMPHEVMLRRACYYSQMRKIIIFPF